MNNEKDCTFILKNIKQCCKDKFCILSKIKEYEFCSKFNEFYFNNMTYSNDKYDKKNDILDAFFRT